jgi:hypothetical protein
MPTKQPFKATKDQKQLKKSNNIYFSKETFLLHMKKGKNININIVYVSITNNLRNIHKIYVGVRASRPSRL